MEKSPSSPNPDAVCEIARHAGFFPPLWFAFAHGINTMNVTCGICILSPDSYIPLPADSSTWVSNVRLRQHGVRNWTSRQPAPLPSRSVCSAALHPAAGHERPGGCPSFLPSSPPGLSAGRPVCKVSVQHLPVTSAPQTPSSLPRSSLCSLHPTPSSVTRHPKGLSKITVHRSPAQTRQPCLVVLSEQSLPSPWPGRPPTLPRSPRGAWSPCRAGSALHRAAGSFPSPGLCTCRLQSFPWVLAGLPPLVI